MSPRQQQFTPFASRARGSRCLIAASLASLACVPASAAWAANPAPAAPHSVISFPERDFVSGSGFAAGAPVTYTLTHADGTTFASEAVTPVDDLKTPGFDGLAEVNHPGGGCWLGTTPDVRNGDVLTATQNGVSEDHVVSNVGLAATTNGQSIVQTGPNTIQVHGSAVDALGARLPDAEVEQRIVANKDAFEKNGRRTLRASFLPGADGALAWDDLTSTNWTATYQLSDVDVLRALGAESRALWLGPAAAAGTQGTIYESGSSIAGGPSAGLCDAAVAETPTTNKNPGLVVAVAPGFSLSSSKLSYGSFPYTLGVTRTSSLSLKNSGTSTITSVSTAIAGTDAGSFRVSGGTCTTSPVSVAAGKTCTIAVTFAPSAKGAKTASMKVDASDASGAAANAKFVTLSATTS